jgi:hypothetical protein
MENRILAGSVEKRLRNSAAEALPRKGILRSQIFNTAAKSDLGADGAEQGGISRKGWFRLSSRFFHFNSALFLRRCFSLPFNVESMPLPGMSGGKPLTARQKEKVHQSIESFSQIGKRILKRAENIESCDERKNLENQMHQRRCLLWPKL